MNTNAPTRFLLVLWAAMAFMMPRQAFAQYVRPFALLKPAPKKDEPSRKVQLFYRWSRISVFASGGLDGVTTARWMSHSTMALRADGSQLARMYPKEVGPFVPVCGGSMFAAVACPAGFNFLEERVADRLYRRGGWGRVAAIGLNVAKTGFSLWGGVHNIRLERAIDARVRAQTGYAGRVTWR